MDLGERIVTEMMTGRLDAETGDRLLDIHLQVVRRITCPISGAVLDSRKSHLVVAQIPDGSEAKIVVHDSVSDDDLSSKLADGVTVTERFDPSDAWALLSR